MLKPFPQIRGGRARRLSLVACVCVIALVSLAWRLRLETPRAWAAKDVPVAFWAWRDETPTEAEVVRAVRETRAQTLFLRAGQFDVAGGQLRRIRAPKGQLPRALPLHLVYNGTREFLAEFERTNESVLGDAIAETFRLDIERAAGDGAQVVGLQLDFDVPTRLLPRYARVLRGVRGGLPPRAQLSITGLQTWIEAPALGSALDAVDFWIPQCYGATIPQRLADVVSISSPEQVAHCVAGARGAGHPFYAGLAAYGHAILYNERGALIELRGDLDPARVARDPNFELLERRPFPADIATKNSDMPGVSSATSREWRYVYRALGDGLHDNLPVRAGDRLLLDVPSAESLRAYARAARAEGGTYLRGLCIFRLPGGDPVADADPTTLTLAQITAALNDTSLDINADVQIESMASTHAGHLRIKALNNGATGALNGHDALALTVRVPAGSVGGVVKLDNIASVEFFCAGGATNELQPCSMRRADTLRLRAGVWPAGATAQAVLSFTGDPPSQLPIHLAMRADDGRAWHSERHAPIKKATAHE